MTPIYDATASQILNIPQNFLVERENINPLLLTFPSIPVRGNPVRGTGRTIGGIFESGEGYASRNHHKKRTPP